MGPPLVIGDCTDPHVRAVADAMEPSGVRLIALDASTLVDHEWQRHGTTFEILLDGEWVTPCRGWVRRLAPAGHHHGIRIGSRSAAEAAAGLALIASLAESSITWLSDYWTVLRAENKLVQYAVADDLGIPVPTAVVASDIAHVDRGIGEPVVAKPLGPGDYLVDSQAFAVHSRTVHRDDASLAGLRLAPFIIQQQVDALRHLRVVTVGDQSWAASLDASGLPLDWRQDDAAHSSWAIAEEADVQHSAVNLARALGLGFTSQDWILDPHGQWWFIDGNPGGQWLFLPPELGNAVAVALARWLMHA